MSRLALPLLLALLAFVPVASAAEYDPFAIYHVAETGSDANPGTEAKPFRTISKALTVSQSYEIVLVHPGAYPRVDDKLGRNYGPVIVRGLGDHAARVAGASIAGGKQLRFENLAWQAEVQIRRHPTIATWRANNIQLVDNDFSSNGTCASIRDGSEQVLFERNHFHNCLYGITGPGTAERDATKILNAKDITIRNNEMERFNADAIQFANWSDVTIDRNNIHDMEDPASVQHNDGIQVMGNSHRVRITNNHLYDSPIGQLILAQDALVGGNSSLLIRNNLLHDAGSWGMQIVGTMGTRLINNTAWNGRWASLTVGWDPAIGLSNHVIVNNVADNLTARSAAYILERDYNLMLKSNMGVYPHDMLGVDPRFVDQAAGDYRLRADSPGIGSGDPKFSLNRGWDPAADGLAGEPAPVVPGTVPLPPGYKFPSWRLPGASVAKAVVKRAVKRVKRTRKGPRVRWATRR